MANTRTLFEKVESWMEEIESIKTASANKKNNKKPNKTKKAEELGSSDHVTDDIEDNTQKAETGERYEENSEDVKKDVPGAAVDETDPNSGGTQDDKQFNIGTVQSATGEQPSVEDDYKSDKDDPGTSHPANTEELGEKYSSAKLPDLLKQATHKAHDLLADIHSRFTNVAPKQTSSIPEKVAAAKTISKATPPASDLATNKDLEKYATDFVAGAIKDAELDADLVGSYLHAYYKQAEGEAPPPEDAQTEGGPPGAEQGPPPEVLAALAQQGGAGGGAMPPGGGDPSMGGGMPPGGDPMAGGMPPGGGEMPPGAGGEMPPGAGGPPGAEHGGMNEEQALQELAQALQELGINPEDLAQMAQSQAAPPGAAEEGQKLATAVKRFKLAGKFTMQEAKTANQRQVRNQFKDYVREITGLKQ